MTVDWNLEIGNVIGMTIGFGFTWVLLYILERYVFKRDWTPKVSPEHQTLQRYFSGHQGQYFFLTYAVSFLGASVGKDAIQFFDDKHQQIGFAWRYYFPLLFAAMILWRFRRTLKRGDNKVPLEE